MSADLHLPLVDQLNDPNTDGNSDNNASANCVPSSIASCLDHLLGRPFHSGDLKDAVYGRGYTGATDPSEYAAYLKTLGVAMDMVEGDGQTLVNTIISNLEKGNPVVGAIPSMWGDTTAADIAKNGGPTHEIAFSAYDGSNLTAMNPWPVDGHNAFYHVMAVGWWATRIVYGHVHVLRKVNAVPVNVDGLGTGFKEYAEAHNLSQVSDGEHAFLNGDTWCGLSNGDVLWWNKQSNTIKGNVGAWVATAIWQEREQFRTQAEALQAQVAQLQAEVAQLKQGGTGQVPPELHSVLSAIANILAPSAVAAASLSDVMKKLGY